MSTYWLRWHCVGRPPRVVGQNVYGAQFVNQTKNTRRAIWILNQPGKALMNSLRNALNNGVVIADGAMGTMLQDADLSLDDFQGHEGCNEILNVTRPEVVAAVHREYFEAGSDAVETNTFGCNIV